MTFRLSQPPHLKKPVRQFLMNLFFFLLVTVTVFIIVEKTLPHSGPWRSIIASLPGLVLSAFFYILYQYLRHYDELLKQITVKALAASGLGGGVVLLVSTSRASIGGYGEFQGGTVMLAMSAIFVIVAVLLSWQHR